MTEYILTSTVTSSSNWLLVMMIALLIAVIAPLVGSFVVSKRYALMADSLAHMSLVGVVIGLTAGIYPIYVAAGVAVILAILMEVLRMKRKVSGELVLAMFMSGGLALALVLAGIFGQGSEELEHYLLGDIWNASVLDGWLLLGWIVVVVLVGKKLYKELLAVAFDEEMAQIDGLPVSGLNIGLMVVTAITVSLALHAVGALLVGALIVIPVMTAMQLKKNFGQTMKWSVIWSVLGALGGLGIAWVTGIEEVGGLTVLSSLIIFLIVLGWSKVKYR